MSKKTRKEIQDENYIPKAFKKDRKTENNQSIKRNNRKIENNQVEGTSKEKKKKNNKKKKKNKLKKIIILIILAIILTTGIKTGISANKWKIISGYMMENQNSTIIDSDGKTIAKIGDTKNKKTIKMQEIPDNLKNAYIAIEDERYYSHGGIDVKRTGGAIASYIFHFGSSSYGGSTITQQLVKNLTGDSSSTITRKIKEWWKAILLDKFHTKDEILEAYLNVIYVGPNIYGVEAGANYYFNKPVKELTLEECAFLAGINNSPNSYNPFSENENREKIVKRTKTVLNKMKELGYINEEEYNTAISNVDNNLKFKKGNTKTQDQVYSYHTDAMISEVLEDIQKKYNISETFANNYIEMAGLTIYSTQNSNVQNETEKEFEKGKYILKSSNNKDNSQSAMVIIDHKTGQVISCVGGLGKKKESRTFNRATQSIRQTGSAIKPIAVLAPAISEKIITNATIIDDTEKDFGEDKYHPTDYNSSLGKITVRRAVESSQNIPFVEIMEKLKTEKAIKYLKKMGVTTLTEKDNTLPLALGGLDKGISPLQMAGAYATIANDGIYIEPTFYTKIEKNNKLIIKSKQSSRRVFSKDVACVLKQLLKQPVEGSKGTATYCKIAGVDVAAKTGTTDENYDRWLCGFTPYYTAVTWYGFDQNESINFGGKNPAGLIWANVMSRVHTGLKSTTFDVSNSVKKCIICSETGMKATNACKNTYTEYFLRGTVPGLCSTHKGTELKEQPNNVTDNKNTIQNIIEGITQEIDEFDPQEMEQKNTNINTNQNSINTINENINNKNTTSTNINTTTNSKKNTNNNKNNEITNNITNENKNVIKQKDNDDLESEKSKKNNNEIKDKQIQDTGGEYE